MKTSLPYTVILAALLLDVSTSFAQLAYTRVKTPISEPTTETPVAAPKTTVLIHGVVRGANGVLPGATVWLKSSGTRSIAVTNSEGIFEMKVPADAPVAVVTCSFGGYREEVVRLPVNAALYTVRLDPIKAPVAKRSKAWKHATARSLPRRHTSSTAR